MDSDCEEFGRFEVEMWGFAIRLQQQLSDARNELFIASKKIEQLEKSLKEIQTQNTLSIDQVINILKALKTDTYSCIKF